MENDSLLVRNIVRKSFGKIPKIASIPNLIHLQKVSFENFFTVRYIAGQKKEFWVASSLQFDFPN